MNNKVSVIKTPDYGMERLEEVVARHMSAFGMERTVSPDTRVLLKPNLLMRSAPERAVTTQPELVEAVLRWLAARGVRRIVIADSPGGPYTKQHLEGVYRACGLEQTAQQYGASLNLETGWRMHTCPEGLVCREFPLIDPVLDADVIINLPRLKTHGMTMLSGAVKNMFGAIPGLQKPEFHLRFKSKPVFASMLVDLSLAATPAITIADAVVSMEGNGPSGGTPRSTGLTFASDNAHALDLALCDFISLPLHTVYTLDEAIRRGLCPASPDGLVYVGDGRPEPLPDFRLPDSKPLSFDGHVPKPFRGMIRWTFAKLLTPLPVVEETRCVGCGKCAESCAPQAAVIEGGKAVIDHGKCIGCFCCQEMCPVQAVHIKRSRLWRF